ncbi:MAG: secretin and TonB N-terminal domain-containing protein [Methylobacter sp.]
MKQLALPLIASLFYCQNAFAEQKLRVDIPAQSLAKALEQFEQQTGVQILYAADATSGKTSPQLFGQYTAEQALKILLDKSGLPTGLPMGIPLRSSGSIRPMPMVLPMIKTTVSINWIRSW